MIWELIKLVQRFCVDLFRGLHLALALTVLKFITERKYHPINTRKRKKFLLDQVLCPFFASILWFSWCTNGYHKICEKIDVYDTKHSQLFLCLDKRLGITDSGLRTGPRHWHRIVTTNTDSTKFSFLWVGGWSYNYILIVSLLQMQSSVLVGVVSGTIALSRCPVTWLRTLDDPITQPIRYLSPDNPSLNQSRLRHCVAVRPWWLQTFDCTLHSINWHSTETLHCCQSLIQRVDCAQHWTNLPNKAGFVGKNLLHL